MALTDNLISYWKFDESSGNAIDSVGSGNDLTNAGTAVYAAGKINNGVSLNGSSQYFTIDDANQAGLDFSTTLSFSLWVNLDTQPALVYPLITKIGQPKKEQYELSYRDFSGTKTLRLTVNNTNDGTSYDSFDLTQTLNNNTWYHIVVTWLGSSKTAKFYINGSQAGGDLTGSNVATIVDTTAKFQVGAFTELSSNYFDGTMDEVGVWNRVLTSYEVAELYNSGNGLQYPFSGATTNTANFFQLF